MANLGDNRDLRFLLRFEAFKIKAAMVIFVVSVLTLAGMFGCAINYQQNQDKEQAAILATVPAREWQGEWCKQMVRHVECRKYSW